jgi:succinyl-diaminopimelate desuccinylase
VPDRCEITIDLRTVPSQDDQRVQAEIAGVLGDGVEIEIIHGARPVRTDEKDRWVAEVVDVMASVTGTRSGTGAAPYFTDASALRPALGGPPTVILGPGELALCHQTDEHCLVDKVEQAAAAYLEIARRWCGA